MDSQPVDVSAEQLEAVLRQTNALSAAFKRAQQVRLIAFLVLVLFVAGLGWVVVAKAKAFASEKNLEKIADIAGKHLEKNQDKYLKQMQILVDKVSPPISKAFYAQAKKDSPQLFNTIEKERQPFLDDLEGKFRGHLVRRYDHLQPRYENILKQEFPQFKDPKQQKRMQAHFQRAVQKLLDKYYVDDLRKEMEKLFVTWDNFPAADIKKGEPPVEDQFLESLMVLLSHRLTHPQASPFE
jgi:hypothetical protein